jgi:hypothetical protein
VSSIADSRRAVAQGKAESIRCCPPDLAFPPERVGLTPLVARESPRVRGGGVTVRCRSRPEQGRFREVKSIARSAALDRDVDHRAIDSCP